MKEEEGEEKSKSRRRLEDEGGEIGKRQGESESEQIDGT